MVPTVDRDSEWLVRLQRTGIEPAGLGGSDDARRTLAAALAEQGVLEPAPGGSARLTQAFADELALAVEPVAQSSADDMQAIMERELGHAGAQAKHLMSHWASPARLAAGRLLIPRLDVGPDPLVAAAELVARLSLLPWLDAVVEPVQDEGEPVVSAERLLDLLLVTGTVHERPDGDDSVLELTPAFTAVRGLRQQQALGWKAAERRQRLGELLLVDDEDGLAEAFRLAGSGKAVGELLALHQLTALRALGLWAAWQALASFARPLRPVDESTVERWLSGQALLMVSSPSSRPAQALEEILTEALRHIDVPVGVINADDERALCERLEVDRPPMVLVLHDGEVVDRIRWAHSPIELRHRLEQSLVAEEPPGGRPAAP